MKRVFLQLPTIRTEVLIISLTKTNAKTAWNATCIVQMERLKSKTHTLVLTKIFARVVEFARRFAISMQ